jgi:hypothetical protein
VVLGSEEEESPDLGCGVGRYVREPGRWDKLDMNVEQAAKKWMDSARSKLNT